MDNRFRVYYMVNLNKSRKLLGWWNKGWDNYGITYNENIWALCSKVPSLKMTPLKCGTWPDKFPEGHYRHYQMKISCLKEEEWLLLHVLGELKDVEYIKIDDDFNEEASSVKNKNGLLPCPFCGGEAKHYGGAGYHCIRCTSCGITNERLVIGNGYYQAYDSYTEAKAEWNRRTTDELLD